MDYYPIQGGRNTSSRFILQKPELSTGTDKPSGPANYDWGPTLPLPITTITNYKYNYKHM